MRVGWIVYAALLGACASSAAVGTPVVLSPAQQTEAKQLIAKDLRDPESARFGTFKAVWQQQHLVMCGWVNSKNAFGGYVGDTKYVARFTEAKDKRLSLDLLRLGDNLDGSLLIAVMCTNAGISFPDR
jgi:hypothetical protein